MATYRIIHSLRLDLGTVPGWGPTSKREIIVNLTREGTCRLKGACRPRPPKTRMVDIRAGDEILRHGQWVKVHGVEVFQAKILTEAEAVGVIGDGYIYRIPE